MNWTKLTLNTTTDAIDYVSCLLSELGIEGIEVSDNIPLSDEDKQRLFIDILPELDTDDKTAKISFYIDEEEDMYSFMEEVNRKLDEISEFVDLGARTIEISTTRESDWIDNWKQYFKAFRIDDNMVIKPTWEDQVKVNEGDYVIQIDPGTAFGTGAHETTKLCITGIKEYINEETTFLDIGCGSGILSIVASKLGASSVTAIDIDPNAVKVTHENIEVNNIPSDNVTIHTGDIINDSELQEVVGLNKYSMIVANIIAELIIVLAKEVVKYLEDDGIFISSGILYTKEEEVKEAIISSGFEILKINKINDWISIIARKQAI